MKPLLDYVDSLRKQQGEMISLLEVWANINSGSDHLEGLESMRQALEKAFRPLNGTMETINLPPRKVIDSFGNASEQLLGKALRITKHPAAPLQIFLGGHMDTVYSKESPFQKAERIDEDIIRGPGVADMKGGLVIMLKSLEVLEIPL